MKSADLTTLIIRVVGLYGILYVVRHLFKVYHKTGSMHWDNKVVLLFELCLMVIGLIIVLFADPITRALTGRDSDDDKK